MPDDSDTRPQGDADEQTSPDPLGILGWVIGGKYRVKSYLGGGGFGEVYAGYNENLTEQRLVIKFFKRVQAREKFAKEAKILCMLDHPNICRVIDYLPDEGAVVMAFISGRDGSAILKESGSLSEDQFINVARSMTDAVAYAHSKKIAHRDIKPGNIIVDKNNHVFLIDFGIAKQTGTNATKTAYNVLTPMFAAPERQVGNIDYNPFLSDIYEVGITLFNFATNSLPYRNPTNPNVNEWGGIAARKLSPEMTRILKKATHPDPKKRYQSMDEMAKDLKNVKSAYGQRRRRSRAPVVAAFIIIALAAAGYFGRGYISDFMAGLGSERFEADNAADLVPPDDSVKVSGEMTAADGEQEETPAETADDDAAEATTETTRREETTPAPPPPPPVSKVLISVTPPEDAVLAVAGKERPANKRFDIDPGRYEATVIQPDYPVYRRTLELTDGPNDISIDLVREFSSIDTLDLQVALIPPSDNHILELNRNGRSRTLHNFPYLGLKQPVGEWDVRVAIRGIGPAEGKPARVDSCVIYPFTPSLRDAVLGNRGILTVSGADSGDGSAARFLIYWSEN